jgi:hypothetical protein
MCFETKRGCELLNTTVLQFAYTHRTGGGLDLRAGLAAVRERHLAVGGNRTPFITRIEVTPPNGISRRAACH